MKILQFLKSIVRIGGYFLLLVRFNVVTNIIFISLLLAAEIIWLLVELRIRKYGGDMSVSFHKGVSFVKSAVRIVGCGLVLGGFSFKVGFAVLLFAELLGFVEEFDEK